ncbi:MAG: NAD(P)H-dependent glycerol-3-phosphate dehydrogenase [Phycisphaerae bacterium]|jgi:glycerol-3-phosphate dehydrogenase (NAD(P)+)
MPAKPIEKATIIGDGAMGTLCAILLAEHDTRVTMWSAFPEHAAKLAEHRENKQFLPGYPLPESMTIVEDPVNAFDDPDLIVSAVPCQYMRSVWERFVPNAPRNVPIVSVAKGIEVGTLLRPTDIIRSLVGDVPLAALSGPSIAPEVAAKKPASVVAASEDESVAALVQSGFSTDYFRVYTSNDPVGVELAGASKNVIALSAGICDGIDGGCNAKASLVTRGLVEITRLGVALGASADTFRGLAGVGDLITTCISQVSRNRTAGERIGRGATTDEVVAATSSVIEGIATTESVLALANKHDVEMPIVSAIASVLFENRRPEDAIRELMTRPLKSESAGA